MDFSRLQSLQYELNSTSPTTNLPSTILELLVPGYSTISQLAFRFLGIDIGILVTGWALIFGLRTAWRYSYDSIYNYLEEHYTSSVEISDGDWLFDYVKSWVSKQELRKPIRKMKVTTYCEDLSEENEHNYDEGYYKYELPVPRYEPSSGTDNEFTHNGRYFKVIRSSMKDEDSSRRETLEIYCYGKTTKPIQDLLLHIMHWHENQETSTTSIYRPSSGGYWYHQAGRPSRPLSTVSLDQEKKDEIVEDMNDYLHPATSRWYAARGIPYRRGYLFYGPPGTGKSSLSFALAGVFGLAIYCISLNDKKMTESDLCTLMDSLPDRCVVLLEDIDSAGLKRDEEPASTDTTKKDGSASKTDGDTTTAAAKETPNAAPPAGSISLSALLNAIDGAASHEGHILIMTTNTPELLDPALIRPGRVDMQVGFTLAPRAQIIETFLRMYVVTPEEQARITRLANTKLRSRITDPEKLQEMAKEFAERLPDNTFSPAEIQGFLLKRKKDAQRALDDVEKWRDEMVEAKKKGKKLVGAA